MCADLGSSLSVRMPQVFSLAIAAWMSSTSRHTWCIPPDWVFLQKTGDGTLVPKRKQQFKLCVVELDKRDSDAVLRKVLWFTHVGPQHVLVHGHGGREVRNSDGNMIQLPNLENLAAGTETVCDVVYSIKRARDRAKR
eukprot:JP447182.1.p1 GENE.JP447182.1~~JP447182.1.p1  ORF type:complete len:138 (-),score=18.89 JP447182.1:58-471(-)